MSSTQPVCRIIPCLDLANGRVVKGVNLVDLNDAGDPIEVATRYAQAGADEIVLLNITGDATNNAVIHRILAQLSQQTKIPITVGGGMRSLDDLQAMITAGASKVSINSAAVDHPELRSEEHTSELQSRFDLVCRLLLEKKKIKEHRTY